MYGQRPQGILFIPSCCINGRIELICLGGFSRLAHSLHGVENIRGHSREICVGKRVNEDGVGFRFRITCYSG